MMWEGSVDPDDALDAKAARRVIRRAAKSLRPYAFEVRISVFLIIMWTLLTLSGPLLVKYAIDQGLTSPNLNVANLNKAVAGYILVAILTYIVYRFLIIMMSRAGEGYLRDPVVGVFTGAWSNIR